MQARRLSRVAAALACTLACAGVVAAVASASAATTPAPTATTAAQPEVIEDPPVVGETDGVAPTAGAETAGGGGAATGAGDGDPAAAGGDETAGAAAASTSSSSRGGAKVTICHRTASDTNPFLRIVVDGASLGGHGQHAGDVIPAPPGGCPEGPPPDTCEGAGLPCENIPEVPAHWWMLVALAAGILGYALVTRLRRSRPLPPGGDAR